MKLRENWLRIFVIICLGIIPFYWIADIFIFDRLPVQYLGRTSYFGFIVFFTLLTGFTVWFARGRKNGSTKKRLLTRLGFRSNLAGMIIGLMVGWLTGAIMWSIQNGGFSDLALTFSGSLSFVSLAISTTIAAPLLEELLFRGHLTNKILHFREKSDAVPLAILASILLFAFIHYSNPTHKIVGGTVFTLIYLWGWGKNIAPAIMAHSGLNSAVLFFSFNQYGTVPALGILVSTIIFSIILIRIIQEIDLVFKFFEEIGTLTGRKAP